MKRITQLTLAVLALFLFMAPAAAEEWIPVAAETTVDETPIWNEPDSPLLAMARADGLIYLEDIDAPLQEFLQTRARCIFTSLRPSQLMTRLAWITEVDLSEYEGTLTDVRWLWMFGDLTKLSLTDATLTDLDVIGEFTALEELTLLNCGVFDLAPLQNCESLEALTLGWEDEYTAASGTFDLAPLTKLKKLNTFALYGAGIVSLEPLTSVYKRVKVLTLSDTAIDDYSLMKKFTNLTGLTLDLLHSTTVADILLTCNKAIKSLTLSQIIFDDGVQEATRRFKSLTDYTLSDCDASNPLFYEDLVSSSRLVMESIAVGDGTSIGEVYADKNTMVLKDTPEPVMLSLLADRSPQLITLIIELSSLSEDMSNVLKQKTSLNNMIIILKADLDLTSDMWKRISGIRDMTLTSEGKTVLSTEFLSLLPNLNTLTLSGVVVESISGFDYATGLTQLNVYGCRISDWSFLKGLQKIETLKIYASQFADADMPLLAQLRRLDDLRLDGNEITDISALVQSSTIRKLDILDNPIEDYTPLLKMTALRTVFLDQGGIITGNRVIARSMYIDNVDYQAIEQAAFGGAAETAE